MRAKRTAISGRRRHARPHSWQQGFAALALILFAFQNYVTQTHIHLLWQGSPDAFVQAIGGQVQQTPAPGKKSPADNPANCPICQDVLLAGHFTTPTAIPPLPPALFATVIEPVRFLTIAIVAASHDWHGRAPPRG